MKTTKKLTVWLAMLMFLLAMACATATGRTIYVDDDGPADFNTIQAAIDDSNDGDTIIVGPGTYTGTGNRDIDFLGKAITIRSENGPENCIIDCGWTRPALSFYDNEDANPIVDGFTIINAQGVINCYGSSAVIKNCTIFKNCSGGNYGGGIYCNREGTVSITNTILWDNYPRTIYIKSGSAAATYTCIQGGWPGEGNIDINPFLTANGHLQADSPCIDLSETGPLHDLDGEARPAGIAFDIGSDEFFDTDNDGLPNWWEMKYFGSIVDSDPNDDTDDDGMNNLEEYILSNNPLGPYHVDGVKGDNRWDGCAPIWNGLHGPKSTIQAAINAAHNGDTIVIADGIYTGGGNMDIDFHGKAITVTSINGPESCIIDCQADEGNEHRGFYFHTSEGPNSVLNGVTITNGVAFYGGGIYCKGSSPTIKRCNIIGNYSRWRDGGGIFCDYSCPRILDSIIRKNRADDDGGGIYCEDSSNAVISNCVICDNRAGRDGGGVVSWYSSKVLLKDCIIARNHAERYGGGLEGFHDSPVLHNCLIVDNSADGWGGGLYVNDGPNFTIRNCTIANNLARGGGGIQVEFYTPVRLKNSILYGNFPNQISLGYHSTAIAEYTDVEGGWDGEGNIDADPCFVEPGYWADKNDPNIVVEPNDPNAMWIDGDYHLFTGSPCIDAGDPNYIAEPNETDLDGKPRVVGGRIDMGAYEYSPPVPAEVDIDPDTLNLTSKGKWITCYIWLPENYYVADIDPNSVFLEGEIRAEPLWVYEQEQLAIAKFSRSEVQGILAPGDVELTVSGELSDGTRFEGTDAIRVIDKGRKK